MRHLQVDVVSRLYQERSGEGSVLIFVVYINVKMRVY